MPLFPPHFPRLRRPNPGTATPQPRADANQGVAPDAQPTRVVVRGRRLQDEVPSSGATAAALLKRYRPLETRATGGFGSVEVCLDTRLQRRVAIKRIPLAAPMSSTPTAVRSAALAEARTASMLQHPNIVSVIDFTYDNTYAYLVMEYVDGMSLEEFLAQVDGNSLTYDECACIADALTQALAFAHENGVLHLDIKPANVLIDHSGHVKLTDFGMATLTSAAGFGGARGGTLGYMAPEQLSGEMVDERSDIFSLAALLYESLCATAPFRAGTPADSLKRIEDGVVIPNLLLPDIPEATEDALLSALDPDPSGRPFSIDEFAESFLDGLGDAREGRRSLARIIARLTRDDEEEAPEEYRGAAWELDPAEGWWGSRTKRARTYTTGVICGISALVATAYLLASSGTIATAALAAAAAATGLAAFIAPQIGSALLACALVMTAAGATEVLPLLATLLVLCPLFAGWWYVWGRTHAASSAVVAVCMAAALATGSTPAALVLASPLATYLLPPVAAAASCVMGAFLAQLAVAAHAAGGALPGSVALSALAEPRVLVAVIILAALAALASMGLERAAARAANGRGQSLVWGVCAAVGIVVLLLFWLANPMENTPLGLAGPVTALGAGALSTIILGICVYLFGYRKESSEGDRS